MVSIKKIALFSLFVFTVNVKHAASAINTPIVSMEVWETHVDRLLNDEPQLEELYRKQAILYQDALLDCSNVLIMLRENKELFANQLKILAEAKNNGLRDSALFDATSKQALIDNMQGIIDSAKEKIASVTKEVEFLTTYKTELKLLYQGIVSQGVTRAASLEKGIERLERVFDSALEAKKKFLDAVFSLVHEAEEMVQLVSSSDELITKKTTEVAGISAE